MNAPYRPPESAPIQLAALESVLRSMESVFGWIYGALDPAAGIFLIIRFILVFAAPAPAVTLMGMTLPVITGTLGRREEGYERSAGWFYGMNTVGAMLGTFVAAFLLVPTLGLFGSSLLAAALDGIVGEDRLSGADHSERMPIPIDQPSGGAADSEIRPVLSIRNCVGPTRTLQV